MATLNGTVTLVTDEGSSLEKGSPPHENIYIEEKEGNSYHLDSCGSRPFLYNKSDADFKYQDVKDRAWDEISDILVEKG